MRVRPDLFETLRSLLLARWVGLGRLPGFQLQSFPIVIAIGEAGDPFAGVDICVAVFVNFHRLMRMGQDHAVESFIETGPGKFEIFILRDCCYAVVAAHPGDRPRKSKSQVRVKESKEMPVEWVPEDPMEHTGSSVRTEQSVTVGDIEPSTIQIRVEWLGDDFDSQFVREEGGYGKVMITDDIYDTGSKEHEFSKTVKDTEISFGNHVFVLEPEVKKIAQYVKMFPPFCHMIEKSMECPLLKLFLLPGGKSQMCV